MRNQIRRLSVCSLTVLLVLAGACTKASFSPSTDGPGVAGGTGGIAGAGDSGIDRDVEPDVRESCPAPNLPCFGAPAAGICDPVCQLGGCSWCTEKCTYVFDGTNKQPACVPVTGNGVFPDSCDNSKQFDDCAPGNICLPPAVGDTTAYCFQLCANAGDCLGGVACGQRNLSSLSVLVGVCDPPYDPCGTDGTCCDPLFLTGCPGGRACLLVSPDLNSRHSRTMCDFSYGGLGVSQPCDSSRDCLAKTTCVNHLCQQVCNTANACPAGKTCTWWGDEYGYCQN